MEGLAFWFSKIAGDNPIIQGLLGGILITFLNMLGAFLIFLWRNVTQRFLDASLGFAAGIMLTASFTSLIVPGIEYGGVIPVIIGIALGVLIMDLGDHIIPHFHLPHTYFINKEGIDTKRIRAVWLFIFAITLHNMPEGLAVGVGFGSGNLNDALVLMMAIGIQNIPEGFAVSVSAMSAGLGKRFYATFVGIRAGLVEIPLALIGAWAVHSMKPILPYAMGFAAGAMLYVISDEIVPETHRKGHERLATLGTMIGVVVMLYLDVALG